MSETPVRKTAQIIAFPARGRTGTLAGDHLRQSDERLPANVAACDFGSGWYHDAALQDDVRKRSPR